MSIVSATVRYRIHPGRLKDDADLLFQLSIALRGVDSQNRDRSRVAAAETLHDLNCRRLSSAVGSEQAENLSF